MQCWRIATQLGTTQYVLVYRHSTSQSTVLSSVPPPVTTTTVHVDTFRLYCCLCSSLIFIFLYRFVFLCFVFLSCSVDSFVELRKTPICLVMPVRLSAVYHLGSHRTHIPEIWYWVLLWKICREKPNLVKTWRKYWEHTDTWVRLFLPAT